MEEIKLGEYCRTDTGEIYIMKYFIKEFDYSKIKHSFNIIDLIEVGDYVNGYKVKYVCNEEPCPSGKYVDVDCELDSSESYFFDNEIKSIVTKEEFANVEYRLED